MMEVKIVWTDRSETIISNVVSKTIHEGCVLLAINENGVRSDYTVSLYNSRLVQYTYI